LTRKRINPNFDESLPEHQQRLDVMGLIVESGMSDREIAEKDGLVEVTVARYRRLETTKPHDATTAKILTALNKRRIIVDASAVVSQEIVPGTDWRRVVFAELRRLDKVKKKRLKSSHRVRDKIKKK